ncbi:MAG: anthranilate phosphoribosyltransferase [Pirellulaceae bacterium]|nr:anthranilate phosphoribosyltransferase [Planctomycetales bacterium]
MMKEILGKASGGIDLSMEEMSDVIGQMMQGKCSEEEIGLLLTALHTKGETVAEIAGAAQAMRDHMTPIRSHRLELVDTCGTGGDGSSTFNISTAAAIVAAAAGASVAKHGNRRVTSRTGSADVLATLGVNVDANVKQVERCLDELGLCFCFAPLMHPSMRNVAKVRKQLGFPTIFNLLGPLCNPARAPYQVLGVGKGPLRSKLAAALQLLGTQGALIVHGRDGMDEVSLEDVTEVSHCDGTTIHEFPWEPADFGLPRATKQTMLVDGPEASAAMIRDILRGRPGPPRDITVLNAAAALYVVGVEPSAASCARRAEEAVDSGAAMRLLEQLAEMSSL